MSALIMEKFTKISVQKVSTYLHHHLRCRCLQSHQIRGLDNAHDGHVEGMADELFMMKKRGVVVVSRCIKSREKIGVAPKKTYQAAKQYSTNSAPVSDAWHLLIHHFLIAGGH